MRKDLPLSERCSKPMSVAAARTSSVIFCVLTARTTPSMTTVFEDFLALTVGRVGKSGGQ
jgi:hypothetical protein